MTVPLSTVVILLLAVGLLAFLSIGVAYWARRAGLDHSWGLTWRVLVGFGLWLAFTTALAMSGVLEAR